MNSTVATPSIPGQLPARVRSSVRDRMRRRRPVPTSDPAALAEFAGELRPAVAALRAVLEDATSPPSRRVHTGPYLRRHGLRHLRELEARLDAAMAIRPEPSAVT